MALLGVSHPTYSLWCTPLDLSPSAQHSLHRTGIRYSTESATPRLGGSSGQMADHAQLTPSAQKRRAGNCETMRTSVRSHVALKCLCLVRLGRLDILCFVSNVARAVTKWTTACDRRLVRLICYMHSTSGYRQYCRVGNTADRCRLGLS